MAAEIMLAAERAPACALGTDIGLKSVWIVGCHVGLEVVSPGKS